MSAHQPTSAPEDGPKPARTLEDAARELRALLRQRRERDRARRQQRGVDMLTAQSARRRAPDPAHATTQQGAPPCNPGALPGRDSEPPS